MNNKIKKVLSYMAAAAFLLALAINVKVTLDDPFVMLSDVAVAQTTTTTTTTATTTTNQILCEATVDCDSIAGEDSEVTCRGFDPMYSCISYPFLFKVKCDDVEHKCKLK